MKFLEILTKNLYFFFSASPSCHDESWRGAGEERPSDSPRRTSCSSPRSGHFLIKVLRLHLLQKFSLVHLRLGTLFFIFMGVNTSFALSLLARISDASICSNSPMVCKWNVSFPATHRVWCISEEFSGRDLRTELMLSRYVFRRDRVIFDHCSKRYYWSVTWHSELPFIREQHISHVAFFSVLHN